MIDKEELKACIEKALKPGYFLVDLSVSKDNDIVVEIDSLDSVDIDECIAVNKAVEAAFDRDREDYSLEVGSSGLTSPFKVKQQWEKNLGTEVEVLAADGKKYRGTLTEADEDHFTVEVVSKVKKEGAKRPVIEMQPHRFGYNEVKYTKSIIEF